MNAQDDISRLLCPDPDHAPPCPIPWSTARLSENEITVAVYTTDAQAQERLQRIEPLPDVRSTTLLRDVDPAGNPLDHPDLIQQYTTEHRT
ncbi:hypothetical protein [Actinomadura rudentiformis]|uniref:Uncharacterized protein n=1 Tax=Actinomadura rudentiformis TaxID=359158 RepID=A0A6H9YFK2_9ACTN|nr:hypothetical protein [Actinomadura rudentiformis]KAB2343409.1 hypothetical protein F8566_35360 [Actinomadura rudentiformis]